ncbi:fumarylacetoacetate hydrolase family protein [Alicyclobacillus fastidiosus]|uniref:Fumarylacetoacetate hydrolase family protein n=1 Tax=Alicyclobacillus fastidiosus TaxID=392011 RepID=A0ABV5A900_9BACL|nr:fumarylacetoacetate hydrolase family protein [Alicyclobacillus fastidiosus]WEH10704.1 fumarylacetoacetate hydrolase family protein [Alicyclobacillus fastidiosus]
MRILSFVFNQSERLGAELDGRIVDLNLACQAMLNQRGEPAADRLADALLPADAVGFLRGGKRVLQQARDVIAFVAERPVEERSEYSLEAQQVQRLAPVPNPGKIVCVGRNYHDHVSEMKREVPTIPVIFAKLPNTICAPGEDVPFPRVSDQFDYEAELAVVIGRQGRYIEEDEALDYVAGYTALNDITVRDWQHRTPQWLQGKSFDKTCPMGPVLVTKDEIPDPQQLDIRLWLNDELRQNDNTSRLIFSIPYLISFVSQIMTLEPGDIIATGTPGGVGVAMEPKGFMKVGDRVKVEIEKIGELINGIVEG